MPRGRRGLLHAAPAFFLMPKLVFPANPERGKEVDELALIAGPAADRAAEEDQLRQVRHTKPGNPELCGPAKLALHLRTPGRDERETRRGRKRRSDKSACGRLLSKNSTTPVRRPYFSWNDRQEAKKRHTRCRGNFPRSVS